MSPLDRRFAYVTGKGGVGKTTVSASLARAQAQRGRRVLLASTEPDHYRRLFPGGKWGSDPVPFDSQISLVAVTPEAAFEEYGRMLIKPRLARRALFANRYAQSFLAAIPGLAQWAVLGKTWFHCTEQYAGQPRFDHVILDAPATGHGLQMLGLPRVISEIAPPGPLRRDALLALEMLQDSERTCITVVSLPEELPTNESLQLLTALNDTLSMPAGLVVANQLTRPCFTSEQQALLLRLKDSNTAVSAAVDTSAELLTESRARPLGELSEGLIVALQRAHRDNAQARCLKRLGQADIPLICLPQARETAATNPAALSQALSDYFLPTPR